MPQTTVPDFGSVRALADQLMHATLQRANAGTLRGSDTERCATIMAAFKDWSEASQRSELVERAHEIAELGRVIGAQGRELLSNVLPRSKEAIREVAAEAVRIALTESAKTNGRRRNSRTAK